jgi:sugar (pentulose or hexulose) kinase
MSTDLTAGLDLGSTTIKALVLDAHGSEVASVERATPWRAAPQGATELDATSVTSALRQLMTDLAERLSAGGFGQTPVRAVAVSGMGETGFVVDGAGTAVAPAFAWFDPRGVEQVEAMPTGLRQQFPSRTGLPMGVQVSATKLAHLRAQGVALAGRQWLGLPEFVAVQLGGNRVAELSLLSRTGLLDQDTGLPWFEMLDHLGVRADFLPPLVEAGADLGSASVAWLPPQFDGARITVAGHDHLVAAAANGAAADGRYYASIGTAEVLVRILDHPLPAAARERLGENLINYVRHVVPGQYALVAGVKTGLLMRRILQLAGITDRAGRDRLDAEVLTLPVEGLLGPEAIRVTGARNDDGILAVTVRSDGVSPAEVFAAALRHGNAELHRLIEAMDREVDPADATVLTGGWASMLSVQRSRSLVLPRMSVSHRTQETAYGAAVAAGRLVSDPTPAQTF